MRDGDTPPRALRAARYVVTTSLGGAIAFVVHDLVASVPHLLLVTLDAGGLSLFAVSGASLALAAGQGLWSTARPRTEPVFSRACRTRPGGP